MTISQIANFVLLATLVTAQTSTSAAPKVIKSTQKDKRGLYRYDDSFIGPPPPPPFTTLPIVAAESSPHAPEVPASRIFLSKPKKFTNVFGLEDVMHYRNMYSNDHPVNGFNYNAISHAAPEPALGFGYFNYGHGVYDYETIYISQDGRYVKQYSVHEQHNNDHPEPNTFKPSQSVNIRAIPLQFPRFYINANNVAQSRNFNRNQRPQQTFLTHNHGPVALGSGGLGFVQLPNGEVYLGSGSLGYISHKEHYDTTQEHHDRRMRPHPRGPLTFGHEHHH